MSEQRRFTVDEANALLPQIQPALEGLRDAQRRMEEGHEQVLESAGGNGGGEPGLDYLEATKQGAACVARLEALGVVVRDPSAGLIDFPAERDGEQIFLCWRLGEDAVAWWHPTNSGFSDRRPL